MGAIYLHIDRV